MISMKSVGQMSRIGGLVLVLLGAGARSTTASAQTLTTLSSFDEVIGLIRCMRA